MLSDKDRESLVMFFELFDKWKSDKAKEFQGTQKLCKHSAFDGMFGFSGWAGCNLHWDDGIITEVEVVQKIVRISNLPTKRFFVKDVQRIYENRKKEKKGSIEMEIVKHEVVELSAKEEFAFELVDKILEYTASRAENPDLRESAEIARVNLKPFRNYTEEVK